LNIYLTVLATVSISAILGELHSRYKKNIFGYSYPSNLMFFFLFIALFLVAGLRWKVGTDYSNYEAVFSRIQTLDFKDILNFNTEYGYTLFTWVILKISPEYQLVFLAFSFFTIGIIVLSIREYSTSFTFSIILYITTMSYFGSFNGIRQWLASAIIFFAYRYIITSNFKKYLTFVIIAALIHNSALIMLPIYFLVKRKSMNKMNLIIIGAFVLSSLFFDQFIQLLISSLDGTKYNEYDTWFEEAGREAHFLRFAVVSIPTLIGYIFYKKLRNHRVDIDTLLNMSLLNTMFMFLALNNYIFARFTIYFELYNLLLIPLFAKLSNAKTNRFIAYFIICCYFVYMFLLLPVDSNLLPYQTIFEKYRK
jgi:transmembrane protein EpsG